VSDAAFSRMEKDLEDLQLRMRAVESVETPRQKELVGELRNLRDKVSNMDVKGTEVTQVRLKNIEDDIHDIREALLRQDAEKRADRRVVLGALLAAATAIGLVVVQLAIQVVK
jgi:hypothetical protein